MGAEVPQYSFHFPYYRIVFTSNDGEGKISLTRRYYKRFQPSVEVPNSFSNIRGDLSYKIVDFLKVALLYCMNEQSVKLDVKCYESLVLNRMLLQICPRILAYSTIIK